MAFLVLVPVWLQFEGVENEKQLFEAESLVVAEPVADTAAVVDIEVDTAVDTEVGIEVDIEDSIADIEAVVDTQLAEHKSKTEIQDLKLIEHKYQEQDMKSEQLVAENENSQPEKIQVELMQKRWTQVEGVNLRGK